MYTGPEVAPKGTSTVRPLPVCIDIETLVPFAPEKTICGVSMRLMLNVALTVSTSPALAELGVIELSTTGTRMVVAAMVTPVGLGAVAGAVYRPLEAIVPYVLFPPTIAFTDHVTAGLNAPVP
jgi:hypothetical protein